MPGPNNIESKDTLENGCPPERTDHDLIVEMRGMLQGSKDALERSLMQSADLRGQLTDSENNKLAAEDSLFGLQASIGKVEAEKDQMALKARIIEAERNGMISILERIAKAYGGH